MANLRPTVIVIFGITGDLAGRKVLPALYHLMKDGLLPKNFKVIGTSRRPINKENLLKGIELCVLETDKVCDPEVLAKFNSIFDIIQFDPENSADYIRLRGTLSDLESEAKKCYDRLFYLSVPPQVYVPVIELLGENGLNRSCEHDVSATRLLVEKPFGYDLASAKQLIKHTARY